MLLEFLKNYLNPEMASILFPVIFVILFLVIGGGALWLTPRVARWLDEREKNSPSFYDGMLESDPNSPETEEREGEE